MPLDKPEKNPYRELMEQVNLTPEARERILTNVQQADLSPQAKKVVPLRSKQQTWRRWASLAACLVVVVAAVLAVPQFRGSDNDTTPPQLTGTPFHQVDTLAALSDAVGFPVTEPAALPFDPVNTAYTAYDEGTAEITYTGPDSQTATYRQSLGTADNSGDYTLYEDTQVVPERPGPALHPGSLDRRHLYLFSPPQQRPLRRRLAGSAGRSCPITTPF